MYLTGVFGSFFNLQKFSSLNKPEEVTQEISANEDPAKNLTTTTKVSTAVTSGGGRLTTIEMDETNGFSHGYHCRATAPLRNLGEGVLELVRRSNLYPKEMGSLRFEWPVIRADVQHFAKRICELYKLTDQQIADAPLYTRTICWLTNNSLFPEYRLRRALEAWAVTGP